MKKILILPVIFASLLLPVLAQQSTVLNQKQAVAIAEKFVAKKGYTDNSPMGVYELEKGRKRNWNLIDRQAVIAFIKKVGEESVWSVQFLLKEQDYKNQEKLEQRESVTMLITYEYGREVRVSLDGKKVWMEKNPLPVMEASLPGDCTGESEKIQAAQKP